MNFTWTLTLVTHTYICSHFSYRDLIDFTFKWQWLWLVLKTVLGSINSCSFPLLLLCSICHESFICQYILNASYVPSNVLGAGNIWQWSKQSSALMELSWMMIMIFLLKWARFLPLWLRQRSYFSLQCVLKVFLVYLARRHANQETKTGLGLENRLALKWNC